MKFKASRNLAEQIADYISSKIIRFELKPGERIMEAHLAEELGVSRSPIREAFRILESRRLVELVPRKGARVTEMNREDIENLYDILIELYGLAARKGIENADEDDLEKAFETIRFIEKCAEQKDVQGYFNAIFQFALLAVKVSKNPILERMMKDLLVSNQRIQFATLSGRLYELESNVRFFQEVAKYIRIKDSDNTCRVIKEYVKNERDYGLRAIRDLKF